MMSDILGMLHVRWVLVSIAILVLGSFVIIFVDPGIYYDFFVFSVPGVVMIFPILLVLSFAVTKAAGLETLVSVLLSVWITAIGVMRYFSFRDLLYPAMLLLVVFFVWMSIREARGLRSRRKSKKRV